MLDQQNYRLDAEATDVMADYIARRRASRISPTPARSAMRLTGRGCRQANRLFETSTGPLDAAALSTISAEDITASRVFQAPAGRKES